MAIEAFDSLTAPSRLGVRTTTITERAPPLAVRAAPAPLAARLEALWLACGIVAVVGVLPLVMLLHR